MNQIFIILNIPREEESKVNKTDKKWKIINFCFHIFHLSKWKLSVKCWRWILINNCLVLGMESVYIGKSALGVSKKNNGKFFWFIVEMNNHSETFSNSTLLEMQVYDFFLLSKYQKEYKSTQKFIFFSLTSTNHQFTCIMNKNGSKK